MLSLPLVFLCASLGVVGCHSNSQPANAGTSASSQKQYSIRGKVVSVDQKDGVIALDTETIPGVMEAMTMAYTLQNPAEASGLHPGDKITAQMLRAAQGSVLSDIVILQQANLNFLPPVQYHVPQPGDTVPDFRFLNQSNREISLKQFRGKVLVLTFIYTRCASSQFCPLMSRNFAHLDQLLAADPHLYANTHLLSISFDPKYDTPAVLRSYGGAYTGRYTRETFQHWDFAAPSPARLASVLKWFDVAVNTSNGMITTHSVSTAVIGPDGKIRAWYPSNTWTPQQALKDIQQIVQKEK
ncbi:MAG TPA: SCO family protein [Acidobacteriaceae bacterium]|nr:SCO family protein [Acidobacteriaceae bacterium]